MSGVEEAVKRLVDDIWAAAQDQKLRRDPGALTRWRTYGIQKVEGLIEEEVQRRLKGEPT